MEVLFSFFFVFFALMMFAGYMAGVARRKRWEEAKRFTPNEHNASARFAENKDLRKAGVIRKDGLFFGYSGDGRHRLSYNGNGHMAVVCAARGGKLLTVLVSLILQLGRKRSLLIVDPKLELTPIVARARARYGKVSIWNPYGLWPDHLKDYPPVSVNPVADIDPSSDTCMADCHKLLGTFWDSNAGTSDPHWLPTAHDLAATVLYTLTKYGKPDEKSLPAMRAALSGANGKSIFEFAQWAVKLPDATCKMGLSRFATPDAKDNKELASVVSTALTQTAWLNNPTVARFLEKADFSFKDLKRTAGTTICIGLPLNRLEEGKAFAMLSGWMLHCSLEMGARGSTVRTVAVIDEMSQIGHSKAWRDAFGMAAGAAGLQIVAVYQDLSQIIKQFGQNAWETVIQNCGLTLWFEVRDTATRQKVSELAGVRQVVTESKNVSGDERRSDPNVSTGRGTLTVPLIHPHEVGALGRGMIAFCEGLPAVIKGKRRAYTEVEHGYGKNPYHRGRFAPRRK